MLNSIEKLYSVYLESPRVQTDTRKLQEGEIFFALKGDNFNGNAYAKMALDKGAILAVIDEDHGFEDERLFPVNDVLATLQELAKYHRQQFDIPFLAVTGSNGKTTTKELVNAVLASTYKTSTTEGNLNNHIGIPLTILKIPKETEIAVIEMGANHQQEIAGYCTYTLPTHGIITNCGKAHLEGFGGTEGVRKGKGELYEHLRTNNGTAFVMWDYDYLQEMSKGIPHLVTYGTSDSDLTGRAMRSEPFLEIEFTGGTTLKTLKTQLVGDYNLPNVLVAVCVGHYFQVPAGKIQTAIEQYTPSNSRSQLIIRGEKRIIMDAYNANPSSMKLAIENFAKQPERNKVLLLGAMAELGSESMEEHKTILEIIKKYPWREVILVGGDFNKIEHPYRRFDSSAGAAAWLQENQWEDSAYLIKGSRSSRMEMTLEAIR